MTRGSIALALIIAAAVVAPVPSPAADAGKGAQLAHQWCANCHVVGDKAAGPVQPGPPSFRAIAQGPLIVDQLRTFLSHPHGAMPDLALSRAEIDDLIAYIENLH